MNKIDKIEVYTVVDENNLDVSEHAIDRALERFNLKDKRRPKVESWIRNKFRHSEFKSTIYSEQYGLARLYINENIGIVLDPHKDIIVTVYPIEASKRVKSRIEKWIEEQVNKTKKLYSKKKRSYTRQIAELNVEKAELELAMLRARKVEKKMALKARINAIDMRIAEMTQELFDLENERAELEVSLVAFN